VIRLLLALFVLLVAGPTAAAGPAVTDARIGVHPDKTRFVLELSDAIAPQKVFTLPNPYRVVIDLPELDWQAQKPEQQPSRGVIEGFHFGLFKPGTSRVVLDLNVPVTIREMQALDARDGIGYRIVLDLQTVSPAVFKREKHSLNSTAESVPKQTQVAVRPPKPTPLPGKHRVVIDPGHGGIDPGATGRNGIYEKAITLRVAKRIKAELEKTGRYEVLVTRDRDIFLSLDERASFAQDKKADLFISIHADSIGKQRIRGASVYTLSGKASDAEAEAFAKKENSADKVAGVDSLDFDHGDEIRRFIFVHMARNKAQERSIHFASMLVQALEENELKLLGKPRRWAGFVVLKTPSVPSVLVELGYLSNGRDAKLLRSPKHQARIARAMRRAVDRYFADAVSMN
jgi:N-acetylmuramoyl-L-alanine amidase